MDKRRVGIAGFGVVGKRRKDCVDRHPRMQLIAVANNTCGMLDARRLALLKPTAVLINAARGGQVDESELNTMLKGNRLAAAAFDVFNDEPPQDAELLSLPNFLATPHVGRSAYDAILAIGRAAIAGLDEN